MTWHRTSSGLLLPDREFIAPGTCDIFVLTPWAGFGGGGGGGVLSTWDESLGSSLAVSDFAVAQPCWFGFTAPGSGVVRAVSIDWDVVSVTDPSSWNLAIHPDDGSGNTPSASAVPNSTSVDDTSASTGTWTITWTADVLLVTGQKYYCGFNFSGGGRGSLRAVSTGSLITSARSVSGPEGFEDLSDGDNMGGEFWRVVLRLA